MYSHSNQQQYDWFALVRQFIELLLAWATLVVFGLWLLCYFLTKECLKSLENTFEGLKRNDGLLILIPAIFFSFVGLILFYIWGAPKLQTATPEEFQATMVGVLLFSLAWGISIGVACLIAIWDEAEREQASSHFTDLSGTPQPFYTNESQIREHEDTQTLSMEEAKHRLLGDATDLGSASEPIPARVGANGDQVDD